MVISPAEGFILIVSRAAPASEDCKAADCKAGSETTSQQSQTFAVYRTIHYCTASYYKYLDWKEGKQVGRWRVKFLFRHEVTKCTRHPLISSRNSMLLLCCQFCLNPPDAPVSRVMNKGDT